MMGSAKEWLIINNKPRSGLSFFSQHKTNKGNYGVYYGANYGKGIYGVNYGANYGAIMA